MERRNNMTDPDDSFKERLAQARSQSLRQQDSWEKAVATGDLFTLMTELIQNQHPIVTTQMRLRGLFELTRKLGQKDTAALIDRTFQLTLAAGAALALQTQIEVEKALYATDQKNVENRLEAWEHVLEYFVRLSAKYAAINHTLALGTQKKQTGPSPVKPNCLSVAPANPGPAVKTTLQTPHSGTGNPAAAAECNPPRPRASSGVTL